MKTAVSIPDDVFQQADQAAERFGLTRSQLYTRAIREFLDEQDDDPVTEALNALADESDGPEPPNVGRALIDRGAWEW